MTQINVLSDVGGVTFTFDKKARKRLWVEESGEAVRSVLADGEVPIERFPGLVMNPYAQEFGLGPDFNGEFRAYAQIIAERVGLETTHPEFEARAGAEVLKGMLIDPTATALLEYLQGEAIRDGRIVPTETPGIRSLMDYVTSTGGVFRGYSTGAAQMPDQFHGALGLDALVGNVKTTFPGHQAKKRSPDQIVAEAQRLYDETGGTFNLHIDDQDNEIEMWTQAREIMQDQGLGNPTIYLFKSDLPTTSTGVAETAQGQVVVVNSLDQIKAVLEGDTRLLDAYGSGYKVNFKNDEKKFG